MIGVNCVVQHSRSCLLCFGGEFSESYDQRAVLTRRRMYW
jgi:hypothetical protein